METFGQTRRYPQNGKNGFSKYRDFTLIELMVVIAIVAIITSFALPSYRTLIEKRQVTSVRAPAPKPADILRDLVPASVRVVPDDMPQQAQVRLANLPPLTNNGFAHGSES